GRPGPDGEAIFEVAVRQEALKAVSDTHLEKTLYSETPKVRDYVEAIRGGPVRWTEEGLVEVWGDSVENATGVVRTLLNVGLLRRLPPGEAGFEVAMLYRPALGLVPNEEIDSDDPDGT